MSGRYLLDTNIVIALFAKNPLTHARIAETEEVFVSCIAVGELYFGAYKSIKVQENIARIDDFVLNNSILSCNSDIAKTLRDYQERFESQGPTDT